MIGKLLLLLLVLIFGCSQAPEGKKENLEVKRIDSLIHQYDMKFTKLIPREKSEFDSSEILEEFSSLGCFKRIDSLVQKIEFTQSSSTFKDANYYFINDSLAFVVYYEKGILVGKQYFRSDSLTLGSSSTTLPNPKIALKVSDSLKKECALIVKGRKGW